MATRDELVALVETFWHTLYVERDLDAIGAMFTDDGFYTDVPIDDGGATGPRQIAARLRIGFGPVQSFDHVIHRIVVDGDTVVTEHEEHWEWPTGERASLPFVSVQPFRAGKIVRWWDYWDMATLMNAAPQWWVEHIMAGYT